jgi:hypothetical protein
LITLSFQMATQQARSQAPRAVVCTSETDRLLAHLRLRHSLAAALASGKIRKTKVAESWLFHPDGISRPALLAAALDAANRVLSQRLLVPLPQLAGRISAVIHPASTLRAARALLHELARSEQILALGLLTNQGDPYLAMYLQEDRTEIERQLRHLRSELDRGVVVGADLLPDAGRATADRAWAEAIIGHGDFRCWGRRRDRSLIPWDAP